jgi:hypothetical protein
MTDRRRTRKAGEEEPRKFPSASERKGKRGHDDNGNVRPADGRWDLHDPKDESKFVRTEEVESDD